MHKRCLKRWSIQRDDDDDDDDAMRCQMEREDERAVSFSEKPRRTPTLAEQYSRFIPVQVAHSQSSSPSSSSSVYFGNTDSQRIQKNSMNNKKHVFQGPERPRRHLQLPIT